jgi:hypothetical protein
VSDIVEATFEVFTRHSSVFPFRVGINISIVSIAGYVSTISEGHEEGGVVALIFLDEPTRKKSRGRSVGIATGNGLNDRVDGVRIPVGSRMFTSPYREDYLWDPPSFYSLGTGGGGLLPRG